jgi:hypothetical protein
MSSLETSTRGMTKPRRVLDKEYLTNRLTNIKCHGVVVIIPSSPDVPFSNPTEGLNYFFAFSLLSPGKC